MAFGHITDPYHFTITKDQQKTDWEQKWHTQKKSPKLLLKQNKKVSKYEIHKKEAK